MKRLFRVILPLCVIAALLCAVGLAEPQAKSWDVKHDHMYSIILNGSANLTVVERDWEQDDNSFSDFWLSDENYEVPEDIRGTWTVVKVSGDDIEVEPDSDGGSSGRFLMKKGVAGQTAAFNVVYDSKALENPVSKVFGVTVIKADEPQPTDYVYEKTEHEYKTGEHFDIKGGKVVPADTGYDVTYDWDAGIIWEQDLGWIDVDRGDGSIHGMIKDPGKYEFKVFVHLTANTGKEIVHTFNISGVHADDELPEFKLNLENPTLERLEDEERDGDNYMGEVRLNDEWGRWEDEFVWSISQTSGPDTPVELWPREGEPWVAEIQSMKGMAVGEYKFEITLKDVTRDESAKAVMSVKVLPDVEETIPEVIYYDSIKTVTTIKAGKTLAFGTPKFTPTTAKIPDDHRFYMYVEDLPDELYRMVYEDYEKGNHTLTGLAVGEYKVHAGLEMFGRSRYCEELVFTLVVEPATGTPVEKVEIKQRGDDDNPYEFALGQKLKLTATVSPKNAKNKKVIWKSENPDAISVSSKGVVTASGEWESAWIYCYAADGMGAFDKIHVQAVPPVATKLAMNKKKLNMKVYEVAQLTVKFTPKDLPEYAKNLCWMSDNTSVVEVDKSSGNVFAKSTGKATIYAYAMDNDGRAMEAVFAKCVITVK